MPHWRDLARQAILIKNMKIGNTKRAESSQTPVFAKAPHEPRPKSPDSAKAKPPKRDNIFSKSRDTREDRGERKIKTAHNPQTFPHGR
jgi:hypothetical protein